MPTKDACSESIALLPDSIAEDFREYNRSYRRYFNLCTRVQLGRALNLYRHIFNEWTTFYKTLDARLSSGSVRSENGQAQWLTFKDEATRAIEGMPESEVARRAKALDTRFGALCKPADTADVHEQAERIILAFDTTRQIVKELALGCAKAQSDICAATTQSEQTAEYRRIVGDPSRLQRYLAADFPNTWAALADGRPLVEIAEEIIRRVKEGKPVQ